MYDRANDGRSVTLKREVSKGPPSILQIITYNVDMFAMYIYI